MHARRAFLAAMHYPHPPPQHWAPPPKQGIGCLGIGLIVFGVGVVGSLAVCGAIVASAQRTPAQRAEDEKIAASAADAEAQRLAEFEGKVRAGCKLSKTAPVFTVQDDELRARCKTIVKEAMTVPSSADFPTDATPLVSDDGCHRTYESYVDGLNAFGVKVRTRYSCTFDPRTGFFSSKSR